MVNVHKYRPAIKNGWMKKCYCSSIKVAIQKSKELLQKYYNIKIHIQRDGKINAEDAYLVWIKMGSTIL